MQIYGLFLNRGTFLRKKTFLDAFCVYCNKFVVSSFPLIGLILLGWKFCNNLIVK